jgi:hypothetical protein
MDEKESRVGLLELVERLHGRLDAVEETLAGTYGMGAKALQGGDRPALPVEDGLEMLADQLLKANERVGHLRDRLAGIQGRL